MKTPTKQELYEQIAALEKLNQKLTEELNQEKVKRWEKLLPIAYEVCRKHLNNIFPNAFTMLRYEHVDDGGYWFTFRLSDNKTVQTYSVRHNDLDCV